MISYPSSAFEQLARSGMETPETIRRTVTTILKQVRNRGDAALIDLTRRFDRMRLQPSELQVSKFECKRAYVDQVFEKSARRTLREVTMFARRSLPQNWSQINGHGARVGEKFDPLHRVGIYIPGGSVPLVSTVFMTVALAKIARVREIVVCTPPPIPESLLWALTICGATEIYRLGGAQAIAAMAYGTKTIRPVHKLFGPGNTYVTEAKRQLFGIVGVDLLAGPSELMILADPSTHIDWAVSDLLAQAEHGSGFERIFCVSSSLQILKKIGQKLCAKSDSYANHRSLKRVIGQRNWLIYTKNQGQMIEVANRLAPEHLQIMTRKPRQLAAQIHTAGGVFLGNHTPTVTGDFAAGPSHTLPTGGAGRAFSGLRVADFMRRTSCVEYSLKSLTKASNQIKAFAEIENLPMHGDSLAIRMNCR